MIRPSPSTPSSQRRFGIFFRLHGPGATLDTSSQYPLSKHISGWIPFVWARFQRASVIFYRIFSAFRFLFWDTTAITASSVTGFFLFFSNLIMAGSWGGYLIAFTARRQTALVFWYKKRRSNATSTPPRHRPRTAQTPPFLFFFIPLVGSLWETRLGRLVIMIPPCHVSSQADTSRPLLLFSFPFNLVSLFLSYG